jgi:hypothetical protein
MYLIVVCWRYWAHGFEPFRFWIIENEYTVKISVND